MHIIAKTVDKPLTDRFVNKGVVSLSFIMLNNFTGNWINVTTETLLNEIKSCKEMS